MQRDRGLSRKGSKELLGELWIEPWRTKWCPLIAELNLVAQVGAPRTVQRDVDERLIERKRDRREPLDADFVAKCIRECLTEG